MSKCVIKNTGDAPLCITDPATGEVYCILPSYTCDVKSEWDDVKGALCQARAQVISGKVQN